ncbi:MAG: suppressor of fused domain protein [Acidobacteria bacterium]|nr:suppressor of fused domain protein [Acidobacteriota bacterium]MCB9397047.1 suppressor of fused domain protein [Acidobacteriota bacterium]
MLLADYQNMYTEDDAPGWLAIDSVVEKLYPNQEPVHWAPVLFHMVGGEDPIDGMNCYEAIVDGEKHFHIVTYGFSNLYYDEDQVGKEFSKFGFELTFRIKPYHLDENAPNWVFNLIQNIARYVFKSGKWFEPYQYMQANGPIRLGCDSKITGLAFVIDPELGEIDTPHGSVQFLQMYGITDNELKELKAGSQNVQSLIEKAKKGNPLLITDLERCS